MNFDYISILKAVWDVVEPELAGVESSAKDFVKQELSSFAIRAENFVKPFLAGEPFSMEEGKLWLNDEVDHCKADLATAEGIGEIAAEKIAGQQMSIGLAVLEALPKAVGL
jgi:hypothetical protein